ncbi:HTH domain-containing protein [Hydrogenoanaerobacterium sp.]|uniref:BglG family transcription antiterminator n=1 Tax=Hydrogenoanaerobacterium sp. TaxID=2953763 RepID=UPI0028A216EA|nr:HTH domain-containing protein [Hydrogenoanaerobacterium sp.]
MKLSRRMIGIIYVLLHENALYTGEKIASKLKVSVRTVKSDITAYRNSLDEYGLELISRKGMGYSIKIINKDLFESFFNPITYKYSHVDEIPDDCDERLNYIIRTLISRDAAVNTNELAEELFLVKRSLSKEMRRAYQTLDEYKLTLKNEGNLGLVATGSEFHKRLCQLDFYTHYYHKSIPNFKVKEFNKLFDVPMEIRLHTRQIFLEEMRRSNTVIKDFYSQKLPVLLLLSYKRYIAGHLIDIPYSKLVPYKNFLEYKIMERIIERTNVYFEKPLPEVEKLFLTVMLLSFEDISPSMDVLRYGAHHTEAKRLADCILLDMSDGYDIQFECQEELRASLIRTLIPVSIGMHIDVVEHNSWCMKLRFDEVAKNPLAQQLGYLAAKSIQNATGKNVCKEKIYQLAYCFKYAVRQRAFSVKKKRILIFPSSGYESARLISDELKLLYGQYIEKIDIQEMYLVRREERAEKYDLILGLEPTYSDNIPAIPLSKLTAGDGYKPVMDFLLEELKTPDIIPYLSKNNIILNLNFKSKEDVLTFLIYKDHSDIQESRVLTGELEHREKVISYDCGNGAAVIINFDVRPATRRCQLLTLMNPLSWGSSEVRYVLYFEMRGEISPQELWIVDKVMEKVTGSQNMVENTYLSKNMSYYEK